MLSWATHGTIVWVYSVVRLAVLCVFKPAVDETLVGHFHCHVVHVFSHLSIQTSNGNHIKELLLPNKHILSLGLAESKLYPTLASY